MIKIEFMIEIKNLLISTPIYLKDHNQSLPQKRILLNKNNRNLLERETITITIMYSMRRLEQTKRYL